MRRDRGRGRRGDRRARQAVARPLQRHRLAGRDAPGVGRRRPRARLAPAPARHLRRARARPRRRRRRLARPRRGRGHAGARPGRVAARRRLQAAKSVALSLGLPLVAVHHLAGHIESLFLHNGPLPLPAVVLVVSGGHTSLYLMPRRRRVPPDRPHPRRRGGRGLRQGGQAARPRLPGRAGDRPRVQGRQRSRLRPAAVQDHAQGPHAGAGRHPSAGVREGARAPRRLQLQRPQDRRAAAGAGARRPAVQRAGDGRSLRVVPARRRRRAADADVRGGRVVRREEHRHRRRRVGQQPAARRRASRAASRPASPCSCRRCR